MPERFSIAQVTPYAWEGRHEVNHFVARAAQELQNRGHRVLIVAPSESQSLVRDSRRALRGAREQPHGLLDGGDGPVLLAAGEVLGLTSGRRRQLPIDVARTIEEALTAAPLDFVHVHDPFAPSASSAALRHSRSLNVGSFHAPTERTLSAQLGRRVVELFFGRLDARTASYRATQELMDRFYPAEYRVVGPGADPGPPRQQRGAPHLVFVGDEERGAARLFLRALRRLDEDLAWRATIWSPNGAALPPLRRGLRERVTFSGPAECSEATLLADADVVAVTSAGITPAPGMLGRALAAGAVPVASRLPVYEEILGEGEYGLLFEPGDALTLVAQLERLLGDERLRRTLADAAAPARERMGWERVSQELEALYGDVAARRHPADGDPAVRARISRRSVIDVDLHMHTDHSHDCAVPVEELLGTAKARGLGAIAITDHNEISGAHEAREKSNGVKVIVAEEVKTAGQGEVIGLFIEEKIPRGLTLGETIAEIKRQGGLVYVPHPFDRLHAVPDYEHLLDVLEDLDAIEVFNPRVAFKPFNEEAARFAAKYRIVAGAGSDSHVAAGLGSVRIRMRDFDGPQEFLESLREADIIRKPTSLLYVQALKFLQTKATPAPARDAAKQRRVRRAGRRAQSTSPRKS
ncbi:MAG: glycosyltransferase [Actinomycetota bacterium]|nr:glycosyltransferase [Actinomycetota bacterium]